MMKRLTDGRVMKVLGWREKVDLPHLGVYSIKAKMDTGAKTSSLHADRIRVVKEGNKLWVHFVILADPGTSDQEIRAIAEVHERRWVKSSSGHLTHRPVIRTLCCLGKREFLIELTLVNRHEMGYRMLLGREALQKRFLIDASTSFRLKKKKKKKKKRTSP